MAPEDREGATSLLQSFERRFLAARALPSFPWQVGGGPTAGVGVEHLGLPGWASGAAFAQCPTWGGRLGPSLAELPGSRAGLSYFSDFLSK